MSKKEFIKDPSKEARKFRNIQETKLSEPQATFNLDSFSKNIEISKKNNTSNVGRPPKNKIYGTLRTQKKNVHRINALQNTLGFDTQDDIINDMLDTLQISLSPEQKIMYDMYMKTYINREKRE